MSATRPSPSIAYAVIGFMRASESWQDFYSLLQRAYPKKNTTMLLPGI